MVSISCILLSLSCVTGFGYDRIRTSPADIGGYIAKKYQNYSFYFLKNISPDTYEILHGYNRICIL